MAIDMKAFGASMAGISDDDLLAVKQRIDELVAARGLEERAARQAAESKQAEPKEPQTVGKMMGGSAVIFVDGSYDKTTEGYSYGMVVTREGQEQEYFARKYPSGGPSSMNNVAGELAGAEAALHYAMDHKLSSVTIHHDYTGIGEWGDGRWKAKNPYTQSYKALVESVRSRGIDVTFEHVKGHTGVELNEKCDELAKHALGIELSPDPKVQQAGAYLTPADKAATIQQAMGASLASYGIIPEKGDRAYGS